jgi:uncharacterized protein YndB with AHSA1/START domain
MEVTTNPRVSVTRSFHAPAERVFDAWLDAKMIGSWMFGADVRDEEVVRISIDPKIGGCFSFVVRRDGQELDHMGEYLAISRPTHLEFTWSVKPSSDNSRVSIDIVQREGGCELTLTHELHPGWASYASRTEAGWNKLLDSLAARVS